jgi:hypothetical protein
MIHIFKVSDGSWLFSGSTCPSNMTGDDYAEGVLPEGETWDSEYVYTCVDGVAIKGDLIGWDQSEIDAIDAANAYKEARKEAYPSIEDQLDDIYHNGVEGWKATIQAIKDEHPKPQ